MCMHLRERARERKRDIDGEERKRRYWPACSKF